MRLYFGSLLPDTAIAKTGAASLSIGFAGFQVIASSFMLGTGTLLLWLLSAALAGRAYRISRTSNLRGTAAWICIVVNAYFPLVLALACLRGQRIEGVRHVLWTIEFPLAWNILQLTRRDELDPDLPLLSEQPVRRAVYALAIFLTLLLPVDWTFAQRVMSQRAHTFLKMRDGGLGEFEGKVVAAGDIGFFGYFSGGEVCDLDGLVKWPHRCPGFPRCALSVLRTEASGGTLSVERADGKARNLPRPPQMDGVPKLRFRQRANSRPALSLCPRGSSAS